MAWIMRKDSANGPALARQRHVWRDILLDRASGACLGVTWEEWGLIQRAHSDKVTQSVLDIVLYMLKADIIRIRVPCGQRRVA